MTYITPKTITAALAVTASLAAGTFGLSTAAQAQGKDRAELGLLDCNVEGGSGFVFGSTKQLACTFNPANDALPPEYYTGSIEKFGLDLGRSDGAVIKWVVLAPTEQEYVTGALAGTYGGVTASASAGVGLGANAMLGGSDDTYALQPFSISGETGINLALAVSQMELVSAPAQ
ncbi:DUF992 domain-containing protein [Pseudosulfitobacter pseudonitzschiae]|uniref:DUF992 domain-containing protein n=1 Tax=Pseudosulfitobacter pseudonitzschiae TaxID=1402135 RepID=UPI0005653103|nr:DUF992 domain-containing protein [Pseudosulfitobacter pseudonitzschiae]MBM1813584.1 DUF992 domain-containing protein [Pseudosulfitobacter pseudonitzschiae]MBM1830577.1 DUF992 domain-containing protein [Pseudosulfitobacter pseudonitzschiae]MBM1835444.1 DUF992 domain-containing protein [Pseudosulfitobacter pseudonitzschiae]MBM1840290.1 DUF992 domain-containing protein [Pseudosulfitobacter pseudonitzschiae]MBM1845722.1 DUF992 domain-containing protein [Pseudosulfitobacter pseudonitzschiae]